MSDNCYFYLMAFYSPGVDDRLRSARFCGLVREANAARTGASFQCGCFCRISMAVDADTKTIRRAGFRSNGCGFMIAAADTIAEVLTGRELTSLHSVEEGDFSSRIESELGPFPDGRRQCTRVVLEAVRGALADYRSRLIEEFRGEKALICTCFGVTEDTIEAFISGNLPESVEEVTAACRAGAGCGSCRILIQEMIDWHPGRR